MTDLRAHINSCRVLLTGATGFVGSHVLNLGIALGAEIHVLSRSPFVRPGITVWNGDLTRADQVTEVLSAVKPDAILHLAAGGVAYGSQATSDLLRVNTVGLASVLEATAVLDLHPAVVVAGSGFEYAPQARELRETDPIGPTSSYGLSKAAATMVATLFAGQMPITILRLFSLYGPGEQEPRLVPYVIAQARKRQPVDLTPGTQVRDYTFVGDAAEAFWRALAVPPRAEQPRILNVASGRIVTLRCFTELLAQEMSQHGLFPDLRFGARPFRPDELMHYTADRSLLIKTLGWSPTTSLEQGLAQTVETLQ
jgi:UDP-glucose 4-epimerase